LLSVPRPLRFALVGLAGIAVQVAVLVALVGFGLNLQIATVTAVGAAILHNFVWHVRWTWVERTSDASVLQLFVTFSAANGLVSLVGNAVMMTVLVEHAGVRVAAASLIAIGTCGILNYTLADLVVFTGRSRWRP
jgi:putative flippase GtrA